MNRTLIRFALVALLPAAFAPAGPAHTGTISVALCSGAGRSIVIPVAPATLPGVPAPGQPCCAKGCHSGQRKRLRV